jgi:hypothetical protein
VKRKKIGLLIINNNYTKIYYKKHCKKQDLTPSFTSFTIIIMGKTKDSKRLKAYKTTEIYTHVSKRAIDKKKNPVDDFFE